MKNQHFKFVCELATSFMIFLFLYACGEKNESTEDYLKTNESSTLLTKDIKDLAGKTDLLTVSDVESVSDLNGIKLVEKGSLTGAGGSLNFAYNNKMFVMVMIAGMDEFNEWKTMEGFVFEKLPDVGDEAYSAPGGKTQYAVFFRKGNQVVSISSFLDSETMNPYLSIPQLSKLARIIVSRM